MKNNQTPEDLLEQAIRAHRRVLEPSVEQLGAFRHAVNSLKVHQAPAAPASAPLGLYAKHVAVATLVAGLGYGWYTSTRDHQSPRAIQPQPIPAAPSAAPLPSTSPSRSISPEPGTLPERPQRLQFPKLQAKIRSEPRPAAHRGPSVSARRPSAATPEPSSSGRVSPAQRLVQADRALRSGQATEARELLAHWEPTARHEKTAAALQILIGCGLHEDVSAKRRQFSKRWPHSSFDQRIAQECPLLKTKESPTIPKNQL